MSQGRKNQSREEVASALAAAKSEILKEWEDQSRAKVPAAKEQSRLALRDSLPQFLDQLVETLKSDAPETEADANARVAREHAEDRAKQPEYTIDGVIYEYQILRSVITSTLDAQGEMPDDARKIVLEFIERGIRKATKRYLELETSKQKAQAKEIEEARIEAERASQAKSAFLANMSHEIRTPLGAIMGFTGLLKEPELRQTQIANYLAIIERNSDHLLRIIDDILDITRVESGRMLLQFVEFSFVELVADFSSLAGLKAREKGITFEFKASTLLPELVISDPTRLRQILSNVVGNAIKFTDTGRVELEVKYEDHFLEFRVIDTGKGISRAQQENLFQAFSQADSSATRKFGGTGLGLALTKRLCQALSGDFVLAQSEPGRGSEFVISLPVKVPPAAKLVPLKTMRITPVDAGGGGSAGSLRGLELLLVEDSPDNLLLIQMMLQKSEATITVAHNGAEGVELALKRRYGVILMDIQMPVMDGHEAVRLLRAKGYDAPVVALTAHAMMGERERAIESGFSHFLTKPINRKSLIDLLEVLHNPLKLRV